MRLRPHALEKTEASPAPGSRCRRLPACPHSLQAPARPFRRPISYLLAAPQPSEAAHQIAATPAPPAQPAAAGDGPWKQPPWAPRAHSMRRRRLAARRSRQSGAPAHPARRQRCASASTAAVPHAPAAPARPTAPGTGPAYSVGQERPTAGRPRPQAAGSTRQQLHACDTPHTVSILYFLSTGSAWAQSFSSS